MKILVKGKVETVSLDRVKPAQLECEPTTGTTIQRKTPNKPKRSTATRTSSRNPQGPPRTGSADTPTSNGTSVQMVHAIVAPNDIYGGPNRMHRIHNVFEL